MHALPAALAHLANFRQFLLYELRPSIKPGGKARKLPVHPLCLNTVSAHDPDNWTDHRTACEMATAMGPAYGVAFVFTENDPLFFVDVDGCIDPVTGEWSPLVLEILSYFPGCAIEVSSSGKGIHIFGVGDAGAHGCRQDSLGLEFYTEGRFVALTGDMRGDGCASSSTPYLQAFVDKFMPLSAAAAAIKTADWTAGPNPKWAGYTDDAALIDAACRAVGAASAFGGRASFRDLWEANPEPLARTFPPDPGGAGVWNGSAADASMAQHLAFWTGSDCDRIERLMRASALSREKWDAHASYLAGTVLRATALQSEFHTLPVLAAPPPPEQVAPVGQLLAPVPPPPPASPSAEYDVLAAPMVGDPLPSVPLLYFAHDLPRVFAGHAYIECDNAIFVPGHGVLDQARFRAHYGGSSFAVDALNGKPTSDAWRAYIESRVMRFPRAVGTCFRPELAQGEIVNEGGDDYVNTYKPITTRRKEGDPSKFLDFLARLLPTERDQRILLAYLAAVVQNPGHKAQWWPVLQGTQGNGKTLILSAMRHAIGDRYSHLPNVGALAKEGGKFNGWVAGKLFLGLEEVYVPHRRDFLEDFKTTVTNSKIPIERKGSDQYMGDNRANGLMTTNWRDGVPTCADQRRYAIFYTAQQVKADLVRDGMDGAYFPDLYNWAKGAGAYAAEGADHGFSIINEFLRTHVPDPEFDPYGTCQTAPRTSSTAAALVESLGAVEQAFEEVIAQGRVGLLGGWVSSFQLDRWLQDSGYASRMPQRHRRDMLAKLGYVPHPGLADGRATAPVMPDGVKPRLYIKHGHPDLILQAGAVGAAYTQAQLTGLGKPG